MPAGAVGKKVGFAVEAFRGDGSGGSIGSGESAMAYVSFPPAPSAKPAKKRSADTGGPPIAERRTDGGGPAARAAGKAQAQPSDKPANRASATRPETPEADRNVNLPPRSDVRRGGKDGSDAGTGEPRGGADSAAGRSDGMNAASGESSLGSVGRYGLYVAVGVALALLGRMQVPGLDGALWLRG